MTIADFYVVAGIFEQPLIFYQSPLVIPLLADPCPASTENKRLDLIRIKTEKCILALEDDPYHF